MARGSRMRIKKGAATSSPSHEFAKHSSASRHQVLLEMATQGVEEIQKQGTASMDQALTISASSLPADQRAEPPPPPLFSKNTLYHASLGCYIVNTCSDTNYEIFGLTTPGHQFEEASMSIRGMQKAYVDRYMIAKHADDTYFVAFQSEHVLAAWKNKYASFTDG